MEEPLSAKQPAPRPAPRDPEILDSGQEEVFSRTEVELGRTEHAIDAGRHAPPPGAGPTPTKNAES